jgi:glycerol-3-phosphate dehydrogenase
VRLRTKQLAALRGGHFDVLVVGAGINGAASAAALACRGANVALVDRGDFASFTSQESSNLVWGGFKYLEHYEIGLVRKLCSSRNRLLDSYPSNIRQVGFVAALDSSAPFPTWLAGLGAFGYWLLGSCRTHRPRLLHPRTIKKLEPHINADHLRGGIEYFDGLLVDNDARFVFSFVRSALEHGATVANYVEVTGAKQSNNLWTLNLVDGVTGEAFECTAGHIVNAAGPFVDGLNRAWGNPTGQRIVYSKGIHLIVPQLASEERVLAFFDETQRLFYVIPMGNRSVIGTTDTRTADAHTAVTDDDRSFLLAEINRRLGLEQPLSTADIISERCGVRPLVVDATNDRHDGVDWTTLSRRHDVHSSIERRIVTIFGGKLTDCLNIGDEACKALLEAGLAIGPSSDDWFGESGVAQRREFEQAVDRCGLAGRLTASGTETVTDRLWRRYDTRAHRVLDIISTDRAMAEVVFDGDDLLAAEIVFAAENEMVAKLEDFLRRRTALSLVLGDEALERSPGLRVVAQLLFGSDADEKLAEYNALRSTSETTSRSKKHHG